MSFQTKINSSESQEKTLDFGVGFHKCSSCGKVFGQRDKLTRHVQCVHENLRPFNCPYCESSFNRKDKMRAHIMSVHMKEKPFVCNHCEFRCARKYRIKEHIVRSHGVKHEEDFSFQPPTSNVKDFLNSL